ncbi:MAG: CocE/NonD family hydrolase [Planctomycetota bacterium]
MNAFMARLVLSGLSVAVMLPGNHTAQQEDLVADWIGWSFWDDGSDEPVWLRVRRDADSLIAWTAWPASRIPRVRADQLIVSDGKFELHRSLGEGREEAWKATFDGSTVSTELSWGATRGHAELHRSEVALAAPDMTRTEGVAGTYRFADGRALVITRRSWGELVLLDMATGRRATMLPVAADEFLLGSALYVPSPVTARLTLRRAATGLATELEWRAQGTTEIASRVSLRETRVTFENGPVTLGGTLILPEGGGPHPAVVVLGSAGWRSRDQARRDGGPLAALGLAVLIYDKRGHGESTGSAVVPFQATAADVVAAVRFLGGRPEIQRDRIGVVGRSRSGWFAPMAAAQSSEIAWLLLLASGAESPRASDTRQYTTRLRADGRSDASIDEALSYLGLLEAYARTGEGWTDFKEAAAEARSAGKPWLSRVPAPRVDDDEWLWTRLNWLHDPIPPLRQVRAPLLVVCGEWDPMFPPAVTEPLMRAALKVAGNADFQFLTARRANHELQIEPEPGVARHRWLGYPPDIWATIRSWLRTRNFAP